MTIFIERFASEKLPKEQTIRFAKKGWVAIQDREQGEYIGMIRLSDDYSKNQVVANKIIELIESELNEAD